MPSWLTFVIIGVLGGISAGFFGIGGGIVIVPGLAGAFEQKLTVSVQNL